MDFVRYPCSPGTVLWVRPGQVRRFDDTDRLAGHHLIFSSAFPPLDVPSADVGPTYWQLADTPAHTTVSTLAAQLTAEYSGNPVSPTILRFLLAALLLYLGRLPGRPEPHHPGNEVYARFQAELERCYLTTRRAEDYADRLGYTVKTLTRACVAAVGHPVKHVIDARVALEAQRLLAHTDEPVAVIARQLGFTEPSNFGKFFSRLTGTTPGEFRHQQSEKPPR